MLKLSGSALLLSAVALLSTNCSSQDGPAVAEGEFALRGCERVAAPVVSDVIIDELLKPSGSGRTCSRTSVADLTNARPQTLLVRFAGAIPATAAACDSATLVVDFYVHDGGQFTLLQQGSTVRGQWADGRCTVPEARLAIATVATYRLAALASPSSSPVSAVTTLETATPLPTTPPPTGLMRGAGPEGPYPVGAAGSSTRDLQPTSERPAPSSEPGFFGTTCDYSHMAKDDPIVFPNQPGVAHLHTFFGNKLANAFSTVESILKTGNSTCRGGIVNRTSYWVPTLLHRGVPVVPALSNFYYQGGFGVANVGEVMRYIPDGLRMIAGSAKATGPQNLDRFHWSCLNNYEPHRHQAAVNQMDCEDDDFIQMDIIFPQCWNARDLDSPDHMSHMAYPENGRCPSTHPYVMPAIELHVAYARRGLDLTQLRLTSDSYATSLPGGYSVHADWFGGWETGVKDAIVDGCLKPGLDCHSHLLGDGRAIF